MNYFRLPINDTERDEIMKENQPFKYMWYQLWMTLKNFWKPNEGIK